MNLKYHIMKKLTLLSILFLSIWTNELKSQNIYGFSDNIFGSINIFDNTKDTLIVFSGNPWINLGFRSAIDRFNGRYFFGGSLPGHSGNFHIIDLIDLSIESHSVYPENIEYDFIKNRLIYENNGNFYSLDLSTFQLNDLGEIENGNSNIYGQNRTFVPQTNKYFYVDYINGSLGGPYFLLIDADSGEIFCQEIIEEINGVFYSPGGLVTNNLTGEIIGHRNGKFGIVNPCDGTMTKLSEIPDYHSHLNNQMAVYNHIDNTYIIPYRSTNSNDLNKIAVVDVYNDEIIETMSQPWAGKMDLQQIYDQPIAPLIYLNDTLFVPKGEGYKWFLGDQLIGETNVNYWIPVESGTYKAEVEFREYTTFSTEKEIIVTSAAEIGIHSNLNIYPNPTSGSINIDMVHSKRAKIRIVDLTGKVILYFDFDSQSNVRIELDELPKGVYLITVDTGKNSNAKLITKN